MVRGQVHSPGWEPPTDDVKIPLEPGSVQSEKWRPPWYHWPG